MLVYQRVPSGSSSEFAKEVMARENGICQEGRFPSWGTFVDPQN